MFGAGVDDGSASSRTIRSDPSLNGVLDVLEEPANCDTVWYALQDAAIKASSSSYMFGDGN